MDTPTVEGFERQDDGRLKPPRLFADDSMEATFWDTGVVRAPMLSANELADLRAAVARLTPSDGFDPRTTENPRSDYHCTFLDKSTTYRRESDQLIRDTFGEHLKTLLPDYRIFTSNIYVKPPGVGRFEIHQNWPTMVDPDVPTVTAWIPLQDTDFHNGTMRLVPGGHHVFPDIAAASSDRFFDDFETELIEKYLRPYDVPAGEALIFDDSLLHWTSDNLSDNPRFTFQIELVPESASTVLWIRNPENPAEFEYWHSSTEFYLKADIQSVFGQPEGLEFGGVVTNPNRRLTLDEFEEAMARAGEIRRAKYVLD